MEKLKYSPLTNIFFQNIRESTEKISITYNCLFSILNSERLNSELLYFYTLSQGEDDYFKEVGKDCWFTQFHKSLRQTDFFSDCFVRISKEEPTKEELSEYSFLRKKVKGNDYNKYGDKTKGELFSKEYNRYLEISNIIDIKRNETEKLINGKLDMILYSLINVDSNVLFSILEQTFKDYNEFLKNKS